MFALGNDEETVNNMSCNICREKMISVLQKFSNLDEKCKKIQELKRLDGTYKAG